jgi:2-oxo-4-hydroxy-4-carboxy-5-ureidoimidazoline decarboxylase
VSLAEFNAASDEAASDLLAACCDVPAWVDAVRDARPYDDVLGALAVADAAARSFSPEEVSRALAAHPRIGEKAAGSGTEAAWSAQEQSGVSRDVGTRVALAEANQAYEERFDRVFLIRAAGRSAPEILAELRRRLDNDDDAERAETITQLREIALLRLRQVVS